MQRVARAEVRVEGEVVGAIGCGLLVLLGVLEGDGEGDARRLAGRIAHLRCFADDAGKMNLAVEEVGGGVLVVSQFTLAADGRKGRRPSFDRAAPPAEAEALYHVFLVELERLGLPVERGRFGASMEVELVNSGPVTFVFDEPAPGGPASA